MEPEKQIKQLKTATQLTADDLRLIRDLKEERKRLQRQLYHLTNLAIAEKFECTVGAAREA